MIQLSTQNLQAINLLLILSDLVRYWLLLPDSHMFTMDAFFVHVSITWNLVLQRSWCYCDACNSITPVRVTPATWGDGDRHYGGQVTTFSQVRITNWKKKQYVISMFKNASKSTAWTHSCIHIFANWWNYLFFSRKLLLRSIVPRYFRIWKLGYYFWKYHQAEISL